MRSNIVKMTGMLLAMAGLLSIVSAQESEGKGPGGRRPQMSSADELIEKYDIDGDGKLNEEERAAMIANMKTQRNAPAE